MKLALAVIALALLPGAETPQDGELVRPLRVSAESDEGRLWFTVRAQNASAHGVLREIARLANRDLVGLERLDQPALVTVELVRRPLDQVLEYTLGSLGLGFELNKTTIDVADTTPETTDDQLDLAAAAWIRAWSRFPDHPDAPRARLAQGEIAEMRGMTSAARNHYLTLIEDYPNSSAVGEAYMRAGRISGRLGQWAEASRLFRTLSNLDVGSEYHATARLEWARAMVAQGDPQAALYMLSALETNYPTTDPTELTARQLVKGRALNARGLYMEALDEIDRVDAHLDDFGRWEALYIRAVALDGIGLPGDAARAWLLWADDAEGPDKAFAFEEAARLSLEAADELAVLFIAREAELAGVLAGVVPYERTARERLGFDTGEASASALDRLVRAEAEIEDGNFTAAAAVIEPLFLARGALESPELSARVCVGWARCVDAEAGLGAAIEMLTEARAAFDSVEALRAIDVGAAQLYEKHDRYDDAVGAYQGKYARP